MRPEDTADFHIRWSWYNIARMYNLKAANFGGTMAIGYALLNISDGLYNNLTSIFTLVILGLSIVLNSLSLIQEQRIFWAKKYKAIFIEMLIISSLLLFSFIFLRFNTLILSIGIISANIARFTISTKIANEY